MQVPVYDIHKRRVAQLVQGWKWWWLEMAGVVRARHMQTTRAWNIPESFFLQYYLGTLNNNLVIGVGFVLGTWL